MQIFGREITLRTIPWRFLSILLAAAVVGAGATIAGVEFTKHTSTDKFCGTTCHSMTSIPADPHYQQSAHISNSAGVRPSCGQCHIPMNNFLLHRVIEWVDFSPLF